MSYVSIINICTVVPAWLQQLFDKFGFVEFEGYRSIQEYPSITCRLGRHGGDESQGLAMCRY